MRGMRGRIRQILSGNASGAALVELAIVLPLFILVGFYFYDLSVTSLCKIWQQSTVGQLVRSIENPPILAEMKNVGGSQQLSIGALSDTELDADYFPRLLDQMTFYLSRIGSGASAVPHGAALQLFFFTINTQGSDAGHATGARLARGNSFVTTPESAKCFGEQQASFETALSAFSQERVQMILDSKRRGLPPFGTNLFDVPIYNPLIREFQNIDSYLELKPLLFVSLCSRPFRFFSSEPVTSLHTIFFDQEVQLR